VIAAASGGRDRCPTAKGSGSHPDEREIFFQKVFWDEWNLSLLLAHRQDRANNRRAQPNISFAWIAKQMPIKQDAAREHCWEGLPSRELVWVLKISRRNQSTSFTSQIYGSSGSEWISNPSCTHISSIAALSCRTCP
jgi:hypothetical protein